MSQAVTSPGEEKKREARDREVVRVNHTWSRTSQRGRQFALSSASRKTRDSPPRQKSLRKKTP